MNLRKREKPQRETFGRTFKNPLVQYADILAYGIMLGMRIVLLNVIKDAGVGLFAPAFEIFLLASLLVSYSMTKAVSAIIRYRAKREQYRNARKAFGAAFVLNLLISGVLAFLLMILSSFIANIIVVEPLSRMAIMAAAPAIIFSAIIGTFRGYFNGFGLGMMTAHSQYIESIAMMICSLGCGGAFYSYGQKVSALLQNEAYSYAYGALGAMLGVMLSQVITLIHLLVVFVVYSGTLRGKLGMDGSKRLETQYSLQRMVLGNSLPVAIIAVLANVFMLLDQRMFNYCMNKREMGEARTALWGSYYGKFAVLIGICTVFASMSFYTLTGKISNAYEREEYRVMRERIGKAVRRLCIVAFPIAIYLAALTRAVISILFQGEVDMIVSCVQKGAILIVLYGFCFLFGQLLYKMHMIRELLLATAASLLIHLLTAYLLVQKALLGAEGLVYALIVFFAVYGGLNFFFISRNLKYRQDWLGSVAFPAAAAGVSGAVVMIVNRLLLEPVGGVLTILIGVVAGVFLYVTFLMILKVIGEAELSRMPLGFFFIMLGKNIGVLR